MDLWTRAPRVGPGTGGVTSPSGVFAMVNGTVIVDGHVSL